MLKGFDNNLREKCYLRDYASECFTLFVNFGTHNKRDRVEDINAYNALINAT